MITKVYSLALAGSIFFALRAANAQTTVLCNGVDAPPPDNAMAFKDGEQMGSFNGVPIYIRIFDDANVYISGNQTGWLKPEEDGQILFSPQLQYAGNYQLSDAQKQNCFGRPTVKVQGSTMVSGSGSSVSCNGKALNNGQELGTVSGTDPSGNPYSFQLFVTVENGNVFAGYGKNGGYDPGSKGPLGPVYVLANTGQTFLSESEVRGCFNEPPYDNLRFSRRVDGSTPPVEPEPTIEIQNLAVQPEPNTDNLALSWNIAEAEDANIIQVQRSDNEAGEFATVHTVELADNPEGDYRWVDENPIPATNFYRLNTVLDNGENSMTNTVEDDPLPIYINQFVANPKDNSIALSWNVATEKNGDRFEVQRMKKDAKDFETIGEVSLRDNPIGNYQFEDENPHVRVNYYRLKMIDLDESFLLSNIISEESKLFLNLVGAPNPAPDYINFSFSSRQSGTAEYEIFTTGGVKLKTAPIAIKEGQNEVKVDINKFSEGMYVFRLKQEDQITKTKFLKGN